MVVRKKAKSLPPDPKGPPSWALAMEERIVSSVKQYVDQKIDEVKQYVDDKIGNLVKKNNLKE